MKKTASVLPAMVLLLAAGNGQAHSLQTAYCNRAYPQGETRLNTVVHPDGSITGTGGTSGKPFTAKVQPDGTVTFLRPDGSIWYDLARMKDGWLFARYHEPPLRGGATYEAEIPCR